MTCVECGGLVIWIGPLTNLTGRECLKCGAVNPAVEEDQDEDEDEDDY